MNNTILTVICILTFTAGWFIGKEYKKHRDLKAIVEQNEQIHECLGGNDGACDLVLNR